MDDVDIQLLGDELRIRGRRESETTEGVTFQRRERKFGSFSRTLRLPIEVHVAKVEARMVNGVLTVTLPKVATARPKKIEIKSASN